MRSPLADEKSMHRYCLPGESAQCCYQKSQVTGTDFKHKLALPMRLFEQMKPRVLLLDGQAALGSLCAWCHSECQRVTEWCDQYLAHLSQRVLLWTEHSGDSSTLGRSGHVQLWNSCAGGNQYGLKCNVGHYTKTGLAKMDQQSLPLSAKVF